MKHRNMLQLKKEEINWVVNEKSVPSWKLNAPCFSEFEINVQCSWNAH